MLKRHARWFGWVLLCVVVLLPTWSVAQEAVEAEPSDVTVVVYDLSGLLATAQEKVDRLQEILTTIQDMAGRQQDWAAYGGSVSSIREMDGRLIVKAPAEAHATIRKLLDDLKAKQAPRQVALHALYLWRAAGAEPFAEGRVVLGPDDVEAVLQAVRDQPEALKVLGSAGVLSLADRGARVEARAQTPAPAESDGSREYFDAGTELEVRVTSAVRDTLMLEVESRLTLLRDYGGDARSVGETAYTWHTVGRIPDGGAMVLAASVGPSLEDEPVSGEVVLLIRASTVE